MGRPAAREQRLQQGRRQLQAPDRSRHQRSAGLSAARASLYGRPRTRIGRATRSRHRSTSRTYAGRAGRARRGRPCKPTTTPKRSQIYEALDKNARRLVKANPGILFNMGKAYQGANQPQKAKATYARFLAFLKPGTQGYTQVKQTDRQHRSPAARNRRPKRRRNPASRRRTRAPQPHCTDAMLVAYDESLTRHLAGSRHVEAARPRARGRRTNWRAADCSSDRIDTRPATEAKSRRAHDRGYIELAKRECERLDAR